MTEPRVAVLILKAENWLSDIFKSLGEKSSRSCSLQHRSKLGSFETFAASCAKVRFVIGSVDDVKVKVI
jgi:hypothetical protein